MKRNRYSLDQIAAAVNWDARDVSVEGGHPFHQVSQRLRYCTHLQIRLHTADGSLYRKSA